MELQRGVCVLCMDNNKVIKPEDARPFMDLIASVVEEQMNTDEFEKVKDLIKICVICCHKLDLVESKHQQIRKLRESGSCQLCRHEEKNLANVDTDWKYFVERTEAWDWLRRSKVAKICTGCVFYLDFMFNLKKKLFSKYPQITSHVGSPKAVSPKATAVSSRNRKTGGFLKHVQPLKLQPYQVHADVKRDRKMYRQVAYVNLSQSSAKLARPKIKIRLRPKSRMHKVTFISGGEKTQTKKSSVGKKRKSETDYSSPRSKRRKVDVELTPILKNPELKNGDSSGKSRRVRFALKDELIGSKRSSDGSSPETKDKAAKEKKMSPKTAKAKKNAAIVNMMMPAKNARRRLLKSRKEDSGESAPTKTKKATATKRPAPEGTRRSSRRAKSDDSEDSSEKDKTISTDEEEEEEEEDSGPVLKETIKLKEVIVQLGRRAGLQRRNSSYVEATQDVQEKGPRRLSLPLEKTVQETVDEDNETKKLSDEANVDRIDEKQRLERSDEEDQADGSGEENQIDGRTGEERQVDRSSEEKQVDGSDEEDQVDRSGDEEQVDCNGKGDQVDRDDEENQVDRNGVEHQLDRNDAEANQPEPSKDSESSAEQISDTNTDHSDKDKNEESPDPCELPLNDACALADAGVSSDGKSDEEQSCEPSSGRTSELADDVPKDNADPPTWNEANDSDGADDDSVRDLENILKRLDTSDVKSKAGGGDGNVASSTENGLGEEQYSTDDSGLDREVTE